eukprot:11445488-Alexandrium_andersonii.AAC.1
MEKGEDEDHPQEDTGIRKHLADANAKGDVGTRTPLGQRFNKAVKPGTELFKKYSQLRTHAAKREFRLEWANTTFEHAQRGKTHVREYQTIDAAKGFYYPFAKIVEEE